MHPRLNHIDSIRIIAVMLLVPFHTAMIFVVWPFHIKNPETSTALAYFNSFLGLWHMPLLFFVSGIGARYALKMRDWREYATERTKRLFVPLVAGMHLIIPPQVYLERLQKGTFSGSFISFIPHVYDGIYPRGNFSWHHLWFLAYLFVFSLLSLPLLVKIRESALEKFTKKFTSKTGILILGTPVVLFEFLLRGIFPNGNQNLVMDWANVTVYLSLFLLGYLVYSRDELIDAFLQGRYASLFFGIVGAIFLFSINSAGFRPSFDRPLVSLCFFGLYGFTRWCFVAAIIGFGRRYLERPLKILPRLNEAVLPFYILHQTLIVIIGYYVVSINLNLWVKFIIIMVASFAGTGLLYVNAVRRLAPLRFLFGMKPAQR